MRKAYLIFFLVFTNATNAQTYFEELRALFYQGERPEIAEIELKPWAGRCFRRENPNFPTNIGLYIREKNVVDDAGPISRVQYEISNYTFLRKTANFLDDKNHDYLASYIEPLYEDLNIHQNELSFYNRQSGRAAWGYLRKNADYLVQIFIDQYGYEGRTRCYYWPVEN